MSARSESPNRIELRELWKLALPLALAQAGQASMGMVDTAVLGRLSAAAQAGAGLGNSLTFTFSFFGMGVMFALDPLVSQAVGAGQLVRARNYFWQGVWLAILTSVVVMIPIAIVPFFLENFGVTPTVAEGARQFMWWRMPGVLGLLLFVALRSYLTGTGRVAATFWAMVFANVANFGLDVLFVFKLGWGVPGAALATVICTWLQFAVLLFALGPSPEGTLRKFDWSEIKQALGIGVPIGLHFIAESGVFSLAGIFSGGFGETSGAAHQVALNWASLTFCVAAGIGTAASTRVGWSVGRQDAPGARRSGIVAFASAAVFMAFAAMFFVAFPRAMASVMSEDAQVIETVIALFVVVAMFQISDGVQAVGAGALRGTGDTAFTFWANMAGHWLVGLPIAWWFGVRGSYGIVGVWWGLSVGLTVVAIALVIRFLITTRKPIATLDAV